MENWTTQKLLNWITDFFVKNDIKPARFCAELLLSHVLNKKRIELYTQFDATVGKEQLDKLHELVRRAGEEEPVQYLTGKTEFYSLELDITADCLIPRPETELLVERAIEFLRKRNSEQFICDLCTGSGCIAVAIGKNFANATIIATDISESALKTAAENIKKQKLEERVKLLCGDLFEPIVPHLDTGRFDLITCNPPYVSEVEYEKLDKNVRNFEPKIALFAGVDGLDVYRRIAEKIDDFLKPDGVLMMETGYKQGPAIRELLEQAGCFTKITIEKDLNNNDRIVIAMKKP